MPRKSPPYKQPIAAEPPPSDIPRERPAPVVLDDAPLILVETPRTWPRCACPLNAQLR